MKFYSSSIGLLSVLSALASTVFACKSIRGAVDTRNEFTNLWRFFFFTAPLGAEPDVVATAAFPPSNPFARMYLSIVTPEFPAHTSILD